MQPPANTASRRNRACSGPESRSWLHSMVARSVRCRGSASRGPVSRSSREPIRSSSCAGEKTRSRAAASSSASGNRSSRAHSLSTTGDGSTSTSAAAARSRSNATASPADSGGTANTRSADSCNRSRLVASTTSSSHAASSLATTSARSGSRCSALSSRTSIRRPWSRASSVRSRPAPSSSRTPSASASAPRTCSPRLTGASPAHHSPPGNTSGNPAAAASASRVLPIPPAPVSVTRRAAARTSRTAATSSWRPTNGVSCTGNLFATMVSEPCAASTPRRGAPARRRLEQRPLRPGQAQRIGQQPGRVLAGGQVNPPLQVTDRPRGKARRLRQLLLGQPGIGAQLPQQPPETRRSLLRHGPHRPFTGPGPPPANRPGAAGPERAQARQPAYTRAARTPITSVTRLTAPPPGTRSCGSPVGRHVW